MVHSDHGEEFGDHGGYHHHSSVYEEQVRVPLLLRLPSSKSVRVQSPVELVDLLPTCANLFAFELNGRTNGHSLLPFVTSPKNDWPPPVAFMQFREHHIAAARLDAIRYDRWKLIHDLSADTYQLFDLAEDPGESRNLAFRSKKKLEELRQYLEAWRQITRGEHEANPTRPFAEQTTEEIVSFAQSAGMSRRLDAIETLKERGQRDKAYALLQTVLQSDVDFKFRLRALSIVALSQERRAVPRIVAMLDDPLPLVRYFAAHALGIIGEPSSLSELTDESRLKAPGFSAEVQRAFLWARALLGDDSVLESMDVVIGAETGDHRVYAAIGRAVIGEQKHLALVEDAVANLTIPWQTAVFGLDALGRRGAVGVPLVYYIRLKRGQVDRLGMSFLFQGLSHYDLKEVAPVIRLLLAHDDQTVRRRAQAFLRTRSETDLESKLRAIGERALAASPVDKTPKELRNAAERLQAVFSESVDAGWPDWGIAVEAWQHFMSAGAVVEASKVGSASRVDLAKSQVAEFTIERLRAISQSQIAPPKAKIALTHLDQKLPPSGTYVLFGDVRVSKSSGGLIGSLIKGSGSLTLRIVRVEKPETVFSKRFLLSHQGILPGESREFLLAIELPAISEGRYRCRLELRGSSNVLLDELEWDVQR